MLVQPSVPRVTLLMKKSEAGEIATMIANINLIMDVERSRVP
jgi:hypothetical protein